MRNVYTIICGLFIFMRNVYTIICGICGDAENQQVVQQDDLFPLLYVFSFFKKGRWVP